MTATQEEPEQGRLSREEAEKLRALLGCTHVAEMDALARLRTGRLIAEATYRPPKRRGDERATPTSTVRLDASPRNLTAPVVDGAAMG
jgi:hypothetical protein